MTKRTPAVLAALAVLSGCGSLAIQDDAPAQIGAALQEYARVQEREMKGGFLQVLGASALQTGTFRQKARLANGTVVDATGTFEAEWARQVDGSWLIARMTINPPPFEVPHVGEVP